MLVADNRNLVGVTYIGDAVSEVIGERVRIISSLINRGKVLGFDHVDFRFGERRMHHPIGEDCPGGIEHFSARADAEHGPVGTRRYDDLATELSHCATESVLRVTLCAALRD